MCEQTTGVGWMPQYPLLFDLLVLSSSGSDWHSVGDHVLETLVQFAQIWARELSANSLVVLNALFDCPAVDFHVKPLRGHMRLLQPFKVASKPANLRSIRRLESFASTVSKPHSCHSTTPRSVMQRFAQALFAVLAVSCALMSTVQSSSMPLTLQPGACSGLEFLDLGQKFHYDAQVAVTSGNLSCIR